MTSEDPTAGHARMQVRQLIRRSSGPAPISHACCRSRCQKNYDCVCVCVCAHTDPSAVCQDSWLACVRSMPDLPTGRPGQAAERAGGRADGQTAVISGV